MTADNGFTLYIIISEKIGKFCSLDKEYQEMHWLVTIEMKNYVRIYIYFHIFNLYLDSLIFSNHY